MLGRCGGPADFRVHPVEGRGQLREGPVYHGLDVADGVVSRYQVIGGQGNQHGHLLLTLAAHYGLRSKWLASLYHNALTLSASPRGFFSTLLVWCI